MNVSRLHNSQIHIQKMDWEKERFFVCVKEVFQDSKLMQQFQPKLDFTTRKLRLYKSVPSLPRVV